MSIPQIMTCFWLNFNNKGNVYDDISTSLQDYLVEKRYKHIVETLKGTQWILQCAGCFAVTDGDIVVRPTNSNLNRRVRCTLFSPLNIAQLLYFAIPVGIEPGTLELLLWHLLCYTIMSSPLS